MKFVSRVQIERQEKRFDLLRISYFLWCYTFVRRDGRFKTKSPSGELLPYVEVLEVDIRLFNSLIAIPST